MYHKFKLLEVQLDLKLDNPINNSEHANKETFSNDLLKEDQSQNGIRELRNNIKTAVEQKFGKYQPLILLENVEVAQPTVQLDSDSNYDLAEDVKFKDHFDNNEAEVEADFDFDQEDEHENYYFTETKVFRQEEVEAQSDNEICTALLQQRQFVTPHDNEDSYEDLSGDYNEHLNQPISIKRKVDKKKRTKITEVSPEIKFTCENCKKPFPALAHLRRHINNKFCIKVREPGNGGLVCPICGKTFTAVSLLTLS